MRPGTKAESYSSTISVYFYSFALCLHLLSLLSLFFILFVLRFSSAPPLPPSLPPVSRSQNRRYARGIVQLFLATSLTDRYTGPAIESPLRDVTPPEMATGQAQPTTFSSRGPEYRVFERLCPLSLFFSFLQCYILKALLSLSLSLSLSLDSDVDQRGSMETRGQFARMANFFFMNNVM